MRRSFILLLVLGTSLQAQERPSIHRIESEFYRDNPSAIPPPSLLKAPRRADLEGAKVMNAVVYGFHPYWQNGSESNYYFSLLTHLAYFSGEIDPTTGNFTTTRSWSSASVVSTAQQHGIKVHFTVTLFSNHAALLNSTTNRSNLISNIISQINLRNADGCNVDFEGVSSTNAAAFRSFVHDLGTELQNQGLELVVELPAVDWSSVYNSTFFGTTSSVVDYYFLMAYDYYWSGSTTAGPVAPVTTGTSIRHVTRSFSYYLGVGCPAGKLIGGFPYYGIEWPVSSSARMATVDASRGDGSSRNYSALRSQLPGISASDKFYDATYNVPWYRYDSSSTGKWRQGWHDNEISLAQKYDSVKAYNLAGTGMWALGYDGTYTELWSALKNAYASSPNASHTSIDAFETGVGRFTNPPTFSGSTTGISTSSSASWSNDRANNGQGSLTVTLIDNPSASTEWAVRLVSGGGTVGNNLAFTTTGHLGFWMRTTTAPSGAQVALCLDDGPGGTLISQTKTVVSNGEWVLYDWDLATTTWSILAGSDNALNGPNATMDAVMFYAPNGSSNWTLWLDDLSHNAAGSLPVQLTGLTATVTGGSVTLEWTTSSEVDNYGFEVERRRIGGLAPGSAEFETIGFVTGSGTAPSAKRYGYVDAAAPVGRLAYRLRQIDRTGAYAYSGEVEVERDGIPAQPLVIEAYPNPFNPTTTVEFRSIAAGPARVRVFNLLGQEVASLYDGLLEAEVTVRRQLDGAQLPSGFYIVRIDQSGSSRSFKTLLSR